MPLWTTARRIVQKCTKCKMQFNNGLQVFKNITANIYLSFIRDMLHFYFGTIRPVLEYAAPVWHSSLTAEQSNCLENVQKRAFCVILVIILLNVLIRIFVIISMYRLYLTDANICHRHCLNQCSDRIAASIVSFPNNGM